MGTTAAKSSHRAQDNPEFEASYARLFGAGVKLDESADRFFDAFYARFLANEDIAALFSDTDMAKQIRMVKKSLFHVVSYYLLSEASPEFIRLARLHARLSLEQWMFDNWLDALVRTVAEFDPEFEDSTRLAWCWAMAPGLTFMKIHATSTGWKDFVSDPPSPTEAPRSPRKPR